MSDDQYITPELKEFFGYHPPPYVPHDGPTDLPPSLTPPHTFYDRHLAEHLFLKRIEMKPLQEFLLMTVDRTLQSLKDHGTRLPKPDGYIFPSPEAREEEESYPSITDAESVALFYQKTASAYCSVLASTFLLYGTAPPRWSSSVRFISTPKHEQSEVLIHFCENYALQTMAHRSLTGQTSQKMTDDDTTELLLQVGRRYPVIAHWDFFSVSEGSETLLKEMDRTEDFIHQQCGTLGYTAPPSITFSQPDATITPWGTPIESGSKVVPTALSTFAGDLRAEDASEAAHVKKPTLEDEGSSSSAAVKKSSRTVSAPWPTVIIPPKVQTRPLIDLYLVRAWSRSAEDDTTFLVFSCGNLERYGYRHRASQTLYLSELVDVRSCEPGYGRLHLGLYLAILQDVISRTKQQRQEEELQRPVRNKRKRTSQSDATPTSKRHVTRGAILRDRLQATERLENLKAIKEHSATRSLALLEIRYGAYNSPSPASFLRLGTSPRKTYNADQYLSVVLTSRIASGATGVVHGAQLNILVDGKTRNLDVVVKLAYKPERIKRMRHEYGVYMHLASRGVVTGIPAVFGLFEDVESDTVALIMSHVGTCLWTLRPDPKIIDVKVTETAKASYLRAMTEIHRAGVRHRDLRPENLMLAANDEVAIIDFDKAELNPSEGSRQREMHHLRMLLDGHYALPIDLPSPVEHRVGASESCEK
ncbi:hypothetical protein DXG01_004184 [Tephrocybe rancida]|nr:hypothetical protein DXG01_004184 [Tephrocybe rancida]